MTQHSTTQQPTERPAQDPAQATKTKSAATKGILIGTSVLGGIALLATAGSALFAQSFGFMGPFGGTLHVGGDAAVSQLAGGTELTGEGSPSTLYADVEGITGIDIEAGTASFTLQYGDVSEATLAIEGVGSGSVSNWAITRDENELVIEHESSEVRREGDTCLWGCAPRNIGGEEVTLTLPTALGEGGQLSADVDMNGGEFVGSGSFDELDLAVSFGSLEFTGAAREFALDVRVGDANVKLQDVVEATVNVSTGDSDVEITGATPNLVQANAKMGALTLALPTAEYRVEIEGSAGEVDSKLAHNPASTSVVRAKATAAEIVLR